MGCNRPLSLKFPVTACDEAAVSHSASVGSRAPAHRAKASASKKLTWHTGEFKSIGPLPPSLYSNHSPSC